MLLEYPLGSLWPSAEQQIRRAKSLWDDIEVPDIPDFEPQTVSEVLLLHVPGSYRKKWEIIEPPLGYIKHYIGSRSSRGSQLQGFDSRPYFLKPTWLGYDFEGNTLDGSMPAALEVLSTLEYAPHLPLYWGHGSMRMPRMSGCEYRPYGAPRKVPALHFSRETGVLLLHDRFCYRNPPPDAHQDTHFTSPTIRIV